MRELANSRGGKCLSNQYTNVDTKLLWQCAKGHVWEATPSSIKSNKSWCPECAGLKKRTIEEMRELAESRGGKCLSDKYVNIKTKLLWQCAKGHTWEAVPGSLITQGTWCPICAGHKKLSLKDMQDLAISRGGKCLSDKYVGIDTKYQWQCSLGHKFTATFNKVKLRGQWCPTCSKSGISEEVCRTTFEQIFEEEFPKVRPKWLKNNRGNQMEIDGYSEKLRFGFEYHGAQHFNTNTAYIKSREKLKERMEDDKTKEKLCSDNRVFLFVITYKTEYKDFLKEIAKQAKQFGIDVSKYNFNKKVDLSRAYVKDDRIDELRNILEKKNIELLSSKFLGVRERYKVRCKIDGSKWSVVGSEIIAGAGCKKCTMEKLRKQHTGSLTDVINYAKKYSGYLLSKEYLGASGKYKFKCKNGHIFCAKLNNLKHRKQWCPVCEGRPIKSKNLGCG